MLRVFFVCFLLLQSCIPRSDDYRQFYSYLREPLPKQESSVDDFFLIIHVNARHLDYTETTKFFQSLAKHPSDCSKNGDVGHAWIYLQGKKKGKIVSIEGGHSGEINLSQPKYCDGVMNLSEDPSERNPIRYLWTEREDGFFQKGSGGHRSTFAIKIKLSESAFDQIYAFVDPSSYSYSSYALTGQQCCSFVVQVAALAGIDLEERIAMKVAPNLFFRGCLVRLWEDPLYSEISLMTPDSLEKKMREAVRKNQAERVQ